MRSLHRLVPAALALGALACGHATHVRPVPQGEWVVQGTLGGPMARVSGATVPMPLSTVGVAHGVSPRADVHAHLHGTSLAFGVAGLDVGGTYLAVEERGAVPAVSLTGRLYGFTDFQAFRPYLEVGAAGSYLLGKRFLTYVSVNTLVQTRAAPLLSFAAGEEVKLGRVALQLELRWYQPHVNSRFMAVEWQGPGSQGALGVLLGLKVALGPGGQT